MIDPSTLIVTISIFRKNIKLTNNKLNYSNGRICWDVLTKEQFEAMCLELYYEYYQTDKVRPENSDAERTKEMIAYYVGDLMEKFSLAGVVVEQKVHVVFEKEDECYYQALANQPPN